MIPVKPYNTRRRKLNAFAHISADICFSNYGNCAQYLLLNKKKKINKIKKKEKKLTFISNWIAKSRELPQESKSDENFYNKR